MKIGDEVKFLNTVGGGIIKEFQGKDIVLVEDETGFDIPVLIRDLIVVKENNKEQVRKENKPSVEVQRAVQREEPEEEYEIVETKDGDALSVHLIYLADDLKSLSTSGFECYLVNDSNYYLSYNYLSRVHNGWISRNNGIIEPNTKLFLEEFSKEYLNDIENICIQLIAYKKDKPFELKEPISQEVRVDTTKFYKLHSFRENDFFDEDAIVYTIVNKDRLRKEMNVSAKELQEAMMSKDEPSRRTPRDRKKEKGIIIEVDLHANELLDSVAGLSNADILNYQLKVFRDVMEENKKKKGQRIVFIHGKGEGVLKSALAEELRKNYKSALSQDASFQEYGFGATMITIR